VKRAYKIIIPLILFLICPLSEVFSFDGPLQVKNQYPIFIHADQPYLEEAAVRNSMSYSLSHSSTYTVQESGEWIVHLDMEITELNFRYKRIIKDKIEFGLDLPVLILGGGFMDGFLEDYHDAFGFPDYGRSERPHNDFLYEIRKNGELIIQGRSSVAIGDIRLTAKKPLVASGGFNLSIAANVEVPVSSAKKGFSNGSFDAGVSVLLDKSITDNIMTYCNFGAVFPGDVRGHEKLNINNFFYGGAAVEASLGKSFSAIVQVLGQSGIYPETDLLAVDRDSYMIAFGGRYKKGTKGLEFSLTEDLSESGAPDFIVNLTYKVNI
jgi:hypothetical protein